VGIDGHGPGNHTVEQVGTEQDVVHGRTFYYAFWEMYSDGRQDPEHDTGMAIRPGDSIAASVQYMSDGDHSGQFLLSIVDTSRPNESFSTYQSSAQTQIPQAERSTAEWIVEATSIRRRVGDLPNFRSVTFSGTSAVINGVGGSITGPSRQSQALNISPKGVPFDATSDPTDMGTTFVVRYLARGSHRDATVQSKRDSFASRIFQR
jgi:hypothetical protein